MDPRSNLYTPRLNLKSGWRTTEFWLSLVALLLSAAYLAGLVPDAGPWARLAAFGALALTMLGYNVSRGIAKTARILFIAGLAVMLSGCAVPADHFRIGPIDFDLPKDGKFDHPKFAYSNANERFEFSADLIVATNSPANLSAQGAANEALVRAGGNIAIKAVEAYKGASPTP